MSTIKRAKKGTFLTKFYNFYMKWIFLFFISFSPIYAQIRDKTIAIVNNEHIFQSEYDRIAKPVIEQYKLLSRDKNEKETQKEIKELEKRILDELINNKLLLQEATKKKIRVTEKEIEDGIKRIKERFDSEKEFKAELEREGITYSELRKKIKNEILIMKLIEQEVKSRLPLPTEEETKQYFEKVKKKLNNEKIPGLTEKEERTLETVAKLVKRHFDELVRVRHIFIACPKDVDKKTKKLMRDKLEDIRSRITKDEDFDRMAELYSEDFLTKSRGGDLGYISMSDELVPKELRSRAFSLKVGEISDIIETETGFHIIKVEEKMAKRKISFECIKNDLMEILFQEKASKALESYITALKSKATIKVFPID